MPNAALHVHVSPPPRRATPAKQRTFVPDGIRESDPNYTVFDPEVGARPLPGRHRSRLRSPSGELLFDVQYTIDPLQRRVVPASGDRAGRKSLLFFGCSFAFGEGLEDSQTLPAQVARRVASHRVFNYAFPGWGPGNTLRLVQKPEIRAQLKAKGGKAIFVMINSHIPRVIGSLEITREWPLWRSTLPYYRLDSANRLVSDGFLQDGKPFESWLFSWLAHSRFLSDNAIDLPFPYRNQHFRLVAAIFKEIQNQLREAGIEDFYVMIYPGDHLAKQVIPFLDEVGVASIDYSPLGLYDYVENAALPDGHPSETATQFLAQRLITDLALR